MDGFHEPCERCSSLTPGGEASVRRESRETHQSWVTVAQMDVKALCDRCFNATCRLLDAAVGPNDGAISPGIRRRKNTDCPESNRTPSVPNRGVRYLR